MFFYFIIRVILISVSCIYGENVCAYSCEKTSDERRTEVFLCTYIFF